MKDNWFWRVTAVLALVVATGYVASRFAQAPPVHAGGDGGYIMEVSADQSGVGRVYLLDTNRKVLIMYGSPTRYDLTMHSSRFVDVDCQATVGKEFPGKPRGWSLREVQASLKEPRKRTR